MEIIDPEMHRAIVTCETPGCGNELLPIDVPISWPEYIVICGGCNQPITNVQVLE